MLVFFEDGKFNWIARKIGKNHGKNSEEEQIKFGTDMLKQYHDRYVILQSPNGLYNDIVYKINTSKAGGRSYRTRKSRRSHRTRRSRKY